MQKTVPNHYFHFNRRERNAILVLLIFVGMIALFPFIAGYFHKEKRPVIKDTEVLAAFNQLKQKDSSYRNYQHNAFKQDWKNTARYPGKVTKQAEHIFFSFDPNTLPADGWRKLGLREKTIATIQKYISKGGKFRKAEDIKKIWGIDEQLSEALMPYVQIQQATDEHPFNKRDFSTNISMPRFEVIDINTADTSSWISLPGIGSKLANRIVDFREKLGGFYSVNQVAETYGLPDSVFNKIRPRLNTGNFSVKKININTAPLDELKAHPYIRYKLASQVLQYRNQHGFFKNVADIKKIMAVSEELYARLEPYLSVD